MCTPLSFVDFSVGAAVRHRSTFARGVIVSRFGRGRNVGVIIRWWSSPGIGVNSYNLRRWGHLLEIVSNTKGGAK